MSTNNDRDVRTQLAREKYFSLRPKPLERWIWQQAIPQAAERVFWVHWEEGMRRGDWCSELSLRQVARECAVDASTVTRAYQALKRLGLVRRQDAGRDPTDPFRQAIAITEVLVPRELLVTLSRYPNRHRTPASNSVAAAVAATPVSGASETPKTATLTRNETKNLFAKLSDPEKTAYFTASQNRRTTMAFDANTQLAPEDRGRLLDLLASISMATPTPKPQLTAPASGSHSAPYAKARQLSPLEAARVRTSVSIVAPAAEGPELFRQVLWSIEQGALRRFDARLALNIALKKIRDGAWTKPNRLPPNWLASARSETCSAA